MTWVKKRVLVTVKAYPEKSQKHGAVVCTAGITDEGEWIRLYPVPFHCFSGADSIKKYDWIEVECSQASEKLGRKESYKIRDGTLRIVDSRLNTEKIRGRVNWEERNKFLLPYAAPSIEDLARGFEEDRTSLGMVKPSVVMDFYRESDLQTSWDNRGYQQALFGPGTPVIDKIQHTFKYRFKCPGCADEKEHNISCEDWELFESYRSWGPRYGDAETLWTKLRQKYFTDMLEKNDLYFYMGTHSQYPTWLIIGLYYPPKQARQEKTEGQKTLEEIG